MQDEPQRNEIGWNARFCMKYFGMHGPLLNFMLDNTAGGEVLWRIWKDLGFSIYETSLYLLREEIYRGGLSHLEIAELHRRPEFFQSLPEDAFILDYGGGTGEFARRDWYDKGGRGHIYDVSSLCTEYGNHKFAGMPNVRYIKRHEMAQGKYDAAICMDVLEHLDDPIETTEHIYSVLKEGGDFLVYFCTQEGIAGHLPESIAQFDEWVKWTQERFLLVQENHGQLWLRKK